MSRAKRKGGKPRKSSKYVSTAALPWNGDHGTGTQAAQNGTKIEPITDEKGANPNRMARRRRVDRLKWLMDRGYLSMRQYQAGKAIQDAYGRVESLSSGSPLKERVQASPKPDATVTAQVEANSQLVHVLRPVLRSQRAIVEHVCRDNQPITTLGRKGHIRAAARFRAALDRVANHMRY